MKLEDVKQGLSSFWDSVAEGWQHLRRSASNALTWFRPSERTNLPVKAEVDDAFYMPCGGWSMLGGNLFEDDKRLVVRLEVPGLEKDDIDVKVTGDFLVVQGEKRFEREQSQGRSRRAVPLPAPVLAEKATATYRNGVLRIEVPKAQPAVPRKLTIRID